jgi:ParB family transcriptional regulator, chromosome partitioning protein
MPRLKELAETTRDAFMIDPRKIAVDYDYNLRNLTTPLAVEKLAELRESIRESGIRVPLLVRLDGEDIVLVQGHRRHAAVMALISEGVPFKAVPCWSEDRKRSPEDRTLDLFLSNDGEPLTELEKAEGIKRLLSYGWKPDDIAKRLGKSGSYVSHLIQVGNMPEAAKEFVRDGVVSASTALSTVRAAGETEGVEILRDTHEEAVRDAAARAPAPTLPVDAAAPAPPRPARVTPKKAKAAVERKKGSGGNLSQAKPKPHAQNMRTLYDALFTQINKFLAKCMDGSYENEDNEVPQRLHDDAKDLAESIKLTRSGFREQEQEAAE